MPETTRRVKSREAILVKGVLCVACRNLCIRDGSTANKTCDGCGFGYNGGWVGGERKLAVSPVGKRGSAFDPNSKEKSRIERVF